MLLSKYPYIPTYYLLLFNSVCCKNHYETLGIEQNATQKEIKEAYIKLGKEVSICKYQGSILLHGEGNILYG